MLRVFACGFKRTQMFYYQESGLEVGIRLNGTNILFTIEIQNPKQSMMMQHYSHQNLVTINVTFQTNKNKVNFLSINLLHVSKKIDLTKHDEL